MMHFTEKRDIVTIKDLDFVIYLSAREIENRIREIAVTIAQDYEDKNPLFLVILNGAFVFAADLMRSLDFACDVQFIKASSYKGLSSTGKVTFSSVEELKLAGRHVIVIEDIVDSGLTLHSFMPTLMDYKPLTLEVCTLLDKPEARVFEVGPKYVAFSISDHFVIGYGLDFDGAGRNLPHIYQLIPQNY